VPFETVADLLDHFGSHGNEFGVGIGFAEYERRADSFMFGPIGPNVLQCNRPQGGFARYDQVTQEYGTVNRRGFLSTYFILDITIHQEASNMVYYQKHCR
jgi:hypothetical protein